MVQTTHGIVPISKAYVDFVQEYSFCCPLGPIKRNLYPVCHGICRVSAKQAASSNLVVTGICLAMNYTRYQFDFKKVHIEVKFWSPGGLIWPEVTLVRSAGNAVIYIYIYSGYISGNNNNGQSCELLGYTPTSLPTENAYSGSCGEILLWLSSR